jgi:hypothetical protein
MPRTDRTKCADRFCPHLRTPRGSLWSEITAPDYWRPVYLQPRPGLRTGNNYPSRTTGGEQAVTSLVWVIPVVTQASTLPSSTDPRMGRKKRF